jgi:hypothetical protein
MQGPVERSPDQCGGLGPIGAVTDVSISKCSPFIWNDRQAVNPLGWLHEHLSVTQTDNAATRKTELKVARNVVVSGEVINQLGSKKGHLWLLRFGRALRRTDNITAPIAGPAAPVSFRRASGSLRLTATAPG